MENKPTLDIAGDIAKIQDQMSHGDLIEFLTGSFNSAEIDGNIVLQTKDGEFLDYVLMDEQYFLDNWLVQFALGFVGGKSYFDHESWYKLTNGFIKGVIVVNETRTSALFIRKFLEAMIPEEGREVLEQVARAAGVAKVIMDNHEKTQIINQLAEQIKYISKVADEKASNSLSSLIPDEYYAKHGVHPLTLQQVIYIRDTYKHQGVAIDPGSELLTKVETILKRWNLEGMASPADKKFITELTNGDFIFDQSGNMLDQQIPRLKDSPEEAINDPFSC